MATAASARTSSPTDLPDSTRSSGAASSGMSWPAVVAGAFATAALWLILAALGTGIGLSSVSPWSNAGVSASTFGTGAIIWLVFTQIIAASLGGYLAGRLRTKWVSTHTDEVYFRDTAHGFLTWAVGLVITAAFLASTVTSLLGGGPRLGPTENAQVAVLSSSGPNAYFVDTLFRSDPPAANATDALRRAEADAILVSALRQKDISAPDKTYLTQMVAATTGLSPAAAEQRVSDVLVQARQAAEAARKAVAHAMYWTFVALLIGAFCASFAATIGGRQRDRVVVA